MLPKESFVSTAHNILSSAISGGPARRAGDVNRMRDEDRPAHNWYRFVLSYPPHLVRQYITQFALPPGGTVLDPFCGTGTTLVECRKLGIGCVGIEPSPMAFFASQVKTDWSISGTGLLSYGRKVAEAAVKRTGEVGAAAPPRGLPAESHKLLLTDSISPLPLHRTLALLEAMEQQGASRYLPYARLALAKALVGGISNLEFGPEVGVGRPKPDAPVVELWLSCLQQMAIDLGTLRQLPPAAVELHQDDARRALGFLRPRSIDAVITSPPYPNEKDYTRTTRLESVLLGFIRNKADLRAVKYKLVRSNTRNVYRQDDDDAFVREHPEVQRIASAIEARRIELGKTSGFERMYARVTKLYFGGMARHLAELRATLKPGAMLAYVVGDQASYLRIMIRTGAILADIAQSLGYELVRIDLFRTRMATATRQQLREEVVVLRWPGKGAQ